MFPIHKYSKVNRYMIQPNSIIINIAIVSHGYHNVHFAGSIEKVLIFMLTRMYGGHAK
jgi:hypothetical protein